MARTTTFHTVEDLNHALSRADDVFEDELGDAGAEMYRVIASSAGGRARSIGGVATIVADSIRVSGDSLSIGGTGLASEVWAGAEFGGRGRPTTQQFLPHLGRTGYFLFPSIRAQGDRIDDILGDALDDGLGRIR